jgi:hypothetical protein
MYGCMRASLYPADRSVITVSSILAVVDALLIPKPIPSRCGCSAGSAHEFAC